MRRHRGGEHEARSRRDVGRGYGDVGTAIVLIAACPRPLEANDADTDGSCNVNIQAGESNNLCTGVC